MVWNLIDLIDMNATEPGRPESRISDRFADVTLTNQFGETVRFHDLWRDGQSLVINTMFTVCKGTCPGTSEKIKALRELLSPSFGKSLVFISITLDPENDSSRMLQRYASIYGAGKSDEKLSNWYFLTGSREEIARLRKSLGFFDLNQRIDADVSQHASLLLFGNPERDRWSALPSALRTPLLIEAIRRFCGFTFEQKYGIPG